MTMMIANKIVEIGHFPKKENKYIVDTNILIYSYGDGSTKQKNTKKESLSIILANVLDIGCDVFIPCTVVSEFINVYHKNYFNKYKKKYNWKDYKKDYRNSQKYVENNKFLYLTLINNILDRCKLISDGFADASIEKLMSIDANQDFNDNVIINIANTNDLHIISDDIDTSKIEIK